MPGKECKGDLDVAKFRESSSFCEGVEHATRGGLVTDNPHPAGDDAAAWAKGFNAYNDGIGTPSYVCCADPVYNGVP